ncbi:type VI secretion system-associated protein TagF [Acidovorax sp. NPDC077693]|uniref:type VI secretion system-associated protein TagF n=1 Tax=unclassified Acidovorax TaxID=2684926 RepID=UPI0037C61143
MSEQPVGMEVRGMQAQSSVAWYGKLPSLGDFAGRRMSHALTTEWDSWLRAGMDELRRTDDTGWPDTFVNAPLWFFIARVAASGSPVIGALAPSMDRVGRYYPLTVMATAPRAGCALADDAAVKAFLAGARAAIVDARRRTLSVDELDRRVNQLPSPFEAGPAMEREPSLIHDILSDLSEASRAHQSVANEQQAENVLLPAGDWRMRAANLREQSLWWVSPTIRVGYQELLHEGACDRWLFTQLFART